MKKYVVVESFPGRRIGEAKRLPRKATGKFYLFLEKDKTLYCWETSSREAAARFLKGKLK